MFPQFRNPRPPARGEGLLVVFTFGSNGFFDGPDLFPIRLGLWSCLDPWPEVGPGEGAMRVTSDVLSVVSSFARFLVPSPMSSREVFPHVGQGGVG